LAIPRVTRPLRFTLGILALATALLPLATAVVLLFNVNSETVRDDARRLHTAVAQDVARAVDERFADISGDLAAVASALVDASRDGGERVALASALVNASTRLDAVAVYGKDGRQMDAFIRAPHTEADATFDAELTGEHSARLNDEFFIDVVEARAAAPARMRVFAPITSNGERTGAVAAWVSLGPLQGLVERLSQVSVHGYPHAILVVGADRRFVAHTTAELAFRRDDASGEPLIAGVELAGDRPASANFVLQGDGVRDDGVTVTGTTISLAGAGRGFIVAVQMPQSIVFASLAQMRRVAAVVVLVAIVLAIVGALLVARSITKPVDALMLRSQALAARRFDEVTSLGDRHDELGVLGDVMAGAAVALKDSEVALMAETRLREGLGRYLPRQLVDSYVKDRKEILLEGKRAEITVLFADIVGFTRLSAKLEPEQLCALLNDLFTILTEIVFKHGGTVDKFIGDSVMAFWGAPKEDADHAEHAIEAARDMLRFLDIGNSRWKKRYDVEIQLAIGINSGVAVVGNLGSEARLVYTAIGESVNIAARLESVAGAMQILASKATLEAAGETDRAMPLGPQELAGVADPVDVYVVEV
jgi:class 3 adenylate cyclase